MLLLTTILFSILLFLCVFLGIMINDCKFTRKEYVIFVIEIVFITFILTLATSQMNFLK